MMTNVKRFLSSHNFSNYGLIFFVAFQVFVARLPFFFNNNPFNPDEGELLTGGIQASQNFIPYRTYTTTNIGPMWPTTLGVLRRFGLVLNFAQAHLLSALLTFLTIGVLLASISAANRLLVWGITLPLQLVWSASGYPINRPGDFAALSTESMPLLFLATGFAICRRAESSFAKWTGGLLLGLSVWFKYQALPLSITLILLLALTETTRVRALPKSSVLKGGAVGIFIVPLIAILSGTWHNLFNESLRYASSYATGGMKGFNSPFIDKIETRAKLLIENPFVLIPIGLIISRWLNDRKVLATAKSKGVRTSLILILVGALTTIAPGNFFPHYSQFFMVAVFMATVVSLDKGREEPSVVSDSFKNPKPDLIFALTIAVVSLLVFPLISSTIRSLSQSNPELNELYRVPSFNASDPVAGAISTICPPGTTVLVWGFSPSEYVLFGWKPAIRQQHTYLLISNPINPPSWAIRDFTNGLKAQSTNCVLEAIGPNYFGFFGEGNSISVTVPGAQRILEEEFSKISTIEGFSGFLWVRKDHLQDVSQTTD